MSAVDRSTFVQACRAATTETLAGFVAALYEAQGWTVERSGAVVVRTDREGETRRVVVRPARSGASVDHTDTVVAPSNSRNGETASVVGYDTLYQQVRYAIDRDTAAELLATHLGVSPGRRDPGSTRPEGSGDGETEPDDAAADGKSGARDRTGTDVRRLLRTLLVAGLIVVALAGVAGQQSPGSPADSRTDGVTRSADSGVADADALPDVGRMAVTTGIPSTAAARTQAGQSTDDDGKVPVSEELLVTRPPGIGANGSLNVSVLARAHRTRLENTTYTLQMSVRRLEGKTVVAGRTRTIRTDNDTAATTFTRVGAPSLGDWLPGGRDNENGENRRDGLGRWGDGATTEPRQAAVRSAALLERYMRVDSVTLDEQWVGDGQIRQLIAIDGSSHSELGSIDGAAFVTGGGLVRFARWSFGGQGGDQRRIVVTMGVATIDRSVGSTPDNPQG